MWAIPPLWAIVSLSAALLGEIGMLTQVVKETRKEDLLWAERQRILSELNRRYFTRAVNQQNALIYAASALTGCTAMSARGFYGSGAWAEYGNRLDVPAFPASAGV